MKKLLLIVLILVLSLSSTYAEKPPLTEGQNQQLTLDFDIFGECMVTNSKPYVDFGFSTEFALTTAIKNCDNELKNVYNLMKEFEFSNEEMIAMNTAYSQFLIEQIDLFRNRDAAVRVKKYLETLKKKEGEVEL